MFHWLRKTFIPQTALLSKGRTRLLILDGHNSHITWNFAFEAVQNNIIVLQLPPHTTHALQPLDVGVFNFLTKAWLKEVVEWEKTIGKITKVHFMTVYFRARESAMSPEILQGAFRRTGIYPYDPSRITEESIAPAEKTSDRASLPIPPTLPSFLQIDNSGSGCPQSVDLNLEDISSTSGTHSITPHAPKISPQPTPQVPLSPFRAPLKVRQIDLPKPPSSKTSRTELLKLIDTLYHQLDRANEELAASHARERLAEAENGEIRQRLYGSKPGRAKTTHSKSGARLVTGKESLLELSTVAQRKVQEGVQKGLGDIFKNVQKVQTGKEKAAEAQRLQEEGDAIQQVGNRIRELEKLSKSLKSKFKTASNRLEAAEGRLANAKTPSTQRAAQKSIDNAIKTTGELTIEISEVDNELQQSLVRLNTLKVAKQDRVDKEVAAKLAQQEKKHQEKKKKEEEDKNEAERISRRPKPLKDVTNTWANRLLGTLEEEEEDKTVQEGIFLPHDAMRLPPGAYLSNNMFGFLPGDEDQAMNDALDALNGRDDSFNTDNLDRMGTAHL